MSALSAGQTISHYRILRPLGAGGMGEVYLAEDTKLGRQVALKVLAHESARDPDRRARFDREARAIAALNHPNIVTIYSVEEDGGLLFITMELVDGTTLADVIPSSGMSLDALLRTAIPLTDAIGTAHQRGITHRDLKPANVMLSHDGRVKVLDFGLAKHGSQEALQTETAMVPAHATAEGRILGTVAYMSPEQAQGKPVDPRSDIFSLGIVLFEMATCQRPFTGDSNVSVLSSILKDRPPLLTDLRPEIPRELARIVTRCLEKDPEDRYQSAKDLRNDLKALKADSDSGELSRRSTPALTPPEPVTPPSGVRSAAAPRRDRRVVYVVAGVAFVAVALAATWRAAVPSGVPRVTATHQVTRDGALKFWPVTDGTRVYFSVEHVGSTAGGSEDLAQVSAEGGETVLLTTTAANAVYPLDIDKGGTELLVLHSPGTGDASLAVRPIVGGTERPIPDISTNSGIYGTSAVWTSDRSQLIFAKGHDLRLARNDGTGARTLLSAPGIPFAPRLSPDGTRLRYSVQDEKTGAAMLWEALADGSNAHPLLPAWTVGANACCGIWTADGRYYLFEAKGNIWARPEAAGILRPAGDPVQLTFGPLSFTSVMPSRDGKRLFAIGEQRRGTLARYDRLSKRFVGYGPEPSAYGAEISPDRSSIVYTAVSDNTLWRSRLDGSERHQLTMAPMIGLVPRWSPDGSRIAFFGGMSGEMTHVYVMPATGGAPRRVTSSSKAEGDPTWSPDGRRLAFGGQAGDAASQKSIVEIVDVDTGVVTAIPGSEGLFSPRWSPDGGSIVAVSTDSLRLKLYDMTTHKWVDLVPPGDELGWPNWSPDGASLFFDRVHGPEQSISRVTIATGQLEKIVDTKDVDRLRTTIGGWIGITPDALPMVTLDAGSHDIYALDWEAP